MRQSQERLLAARGISLGETIPASGLRVILAKDRAANSLLLVRGKIYGPAWPSIADLLEQSGIEYSLIDAGKTWLVAADSSITREVLQQSANRARQSANEQILVPDVGFVSAGRKRKFELRSLIGPALLALFSLGLALVPSITPTITQQAEVESPEVACALDLDDSEIENWIASSVDSVATSSGEFMLESKLGILRLEIQQTLGSTQSVTGSINCDDGRSKHLHFRLDASANGALVELGQKLDP
jgi:hypothetical protein